ncbi:MAG: hypothetical protein JW945_04190 [Methanomicrobia archaeon]|nr:hypothetical protein [Methanomicrobia archaeon]
MKRTVFAALVLLLLALILTLTAAQIEYESEDDEVRTQLLQKYQAELESDFLIIEGDPFSRNLADPLVVVGSSLDVIEQRYHPIILAEFPGVPQVSDTETTYNGRSIYDYNLVLIGGPTHNRVTATLSEAGLFEFERKTSKPRVVVMEISNATAAGSGVLCGTIYGFTFVPDKWVPMMALLPPEAVPAAAAATGIFLAWLLPKLIAFLREFAKTATEEISEELLLEKTRPSLAPQQFPKSALLGLSKIELMHLTASFVFFGLFMAWAESSISEFVQNLPAYLLGAGLVLIIHEYVHDLASHRFGIEAEFRMSPVGMISVAITSVLFGTVFAIPGRTFIYGDATDAQRGKIAFVGPLVSIVMVALFWLLLHRGGFAGALGFAGFNLAFIMAVYEMLPIRPLEGKEVRAWSRWAWRLYFFPVFILYAWIFLFL